MGRISTESLTTNHMEQDVWEIISVTHTLLSAYCIKYQTLPLICNQCIKDFFFMSSTLHLLLFHVLQRQISAIQDN